MVFRTNKALNKKIVNDSLFKEYVKYRNLKSETIRSYTRKITIYSTLTKLTPTQLIEEAETDEDKGIRKRLRKIKAHLTDLQEYLISNDYSPQKIEDIITTIRGFYAYYEIELPKRTYHAPVPDLQKEDIPSKEDINKALSFCNKKYQSIILLMSSSGISLGDVLNLKFSDFLNGLNIPTEHHEIDILDYIEYDRICSKNQVPMWHIKRMKSGTSHITFNTPETTQNIIHYLVENPPKDVDDPLFRGKTGKRLRNDVFQRFLRKLNKQCEWDDVGRQIFFHSHILRKIFANKLEEAGMPHHYIRQLMGHRKDPLTRTYFSTPSEKLRDEYHKFMHYLNFIEETELEKINTQ
jgi:integrase